MVTKVMGGCTVPKEKKMLFLKPLSVKDLSSDN